MCWFSLLPRNCREIAEKTEEVANEPRPHGVRKIEGSERAYRIMVGNYRVVYEIYDDEKLVLILQLARRTETTYRSQE